MIGKEAIKPKVKGESDFFSWQLFRWIRSRTELYRVWRDEQQELVIGGIYYGDDSISGRRLRTLYFHDKNLSVYSFCMHDCSKWEEITEQFWKDYMEKGVCAIHGDNAHKWGDTDISGEFPERTCLYCKKVEVQKTKMVEVEERV